MINAKMWHKKKLIPKSYDVTKMITNYWCGGIVDKYRIRLYYRYVPNGIHQLQGATVDSHRCIKM